MDSESEKQKMLTLVNTVFDHIMQMVDSLTPEEKQEKGSLSTMVCQGHPGQSDFLVAPLQLPAGKISQG